MDTPLINGLFVFFLGILVIFVGMLIIILAVTLCGNLINRTKKETIQTKNVESVKDTSQEEIPEHVKVAIVAVISQYYFNQKSKCDFVVKKIKKI